jgi:hypothetical protein
MDALPLDDDEPRATQPAADWHPGLRFAPRTARSQPPRWQRIGIGIAVVALHFVAGWFVAMQMQPHPEPYVEDVAIVVDYVVLLSPQVIRPEPEPGRAEADAAQRIVQRTVASTPVERAQRTPAASDAPLQVYAPDGSLRLPDGLMETLDAQAFDKQFDFQLPNLDASARLLDRPSPIEYTATRFDKYYAPNETLLSEVLRKAIEKTSPEIRIPVPGAPGRFLVCRIVILAAGGACGIERIGGYGRPGEDDPKTLSPDEAKACQAWWDKIVGAKTQTEWRATRQLYDAECLKPLLKEPPAPIERAPPAAETAQ